MTKEVSCEIIYPTVNDSLATTQNWFAGIITGQLKDNLIKPITPNGGFVEEEAARYIVPSPTLKPYERIQIYNQQYWWRLLKVMHENFPMVVRLFGYYSFNDSLAIPYLLKYPPNHWSLNTLGENLSNWIEEEYHESDKRLVKNAVNLDWAFLYGFVSPHLAPLDILIQTNSEKLLKTKLYLQPYIFLFKWDCDMLAFREAFLKESIDYWTEHDFPYLHKGKNYYFVLYRNSFNQLKWREISAGQYVLLETIKQGTTIEAACEVLEKQAKSVYEDAAQNLQSWFQEWVQRGWITMHTPLKRKQ